MHSAISINPTHTKGFTLIELAIALMVIGLLIGGVLKGQELINNARIIKTVKQVQDYKAAVQIFRSTYDAWPGDIRTPSRIPNCTGLPCMAAGNGNTILDPVGGSLYVNNITTQAPFVYTGDARNFWRHLSKAGLITGINDNSTTYPTPFEWGVDFPAAPYDGTGFVPFQLGWQGLNGIIMMHTDASTRGAVLAKDAAQIDRKIDDGKPFYQGDVMVTDDYGPGRAALAATCISVRNETATYVETATTGGCTMYFLLIN